jgi:hypothetical protein
LSKSEDEVFAAACHLRPLGFHIFATLGKEIFSTIRTISSIAIPSAAWCTIIERIGGRFLLRAFFDLHAKRVEVNRTLRVTHLGPSIKHY